MKTKKKNTSPAWALVLGYLASVLLVVLAALIVLATTFCSADFMQKEVQRSAFASAAYNLLVDNYESYAAATGFDGAVLAGQISEEQIETDMKAAVADMYNGDTAFDLRSQIAQATYDAMTNDLAMREIEVTDAVDSGIIVVADACRSDYASYVSVPLASQFYTLVTKIDRALWVGIAVAAVFAAAALILMLRLAPGAKTAVRCLFFSFTAAAVLCLLVAVVLYPVMGLSRLQLNPTSMRLLLLQYVKDLLGRFGIFAVIYGIVAAALATLNGMARAKAKQRAQNFANR